MCHFAMAKSILITGGARSGKSAYAERRIAAMGGAPIYVATAEARDGEMAERVAQHRARRGPEWGLIEEPLDLIGALNRSDQGPRLVDCLTLWLSNLMFADRDWKAEGVRVANAIPALTHPVVFVTNEVGLGIVPDNALARRFRDAAGWLNQTIAEASDEVVLVVAGQPLKVKPQ
ncbi:Bifunctional adenosylcobalamin biosynthesis protein CobP [Palleronia abyssalis]|uniref:Bifunctional adenosylcobalamin biosynthesis protein n=2 Tax=Palleronia abyssalis TaxID=1501240 RepID=A0A2R8BTA7_9RHOB|nr:Bifunctional adenosylcobalamin biosynthesis protein CobP [Palleronia abyssalis]